MVRKGKPASMLSRTACETWAGQLEGELGGPLFHRERQHLTELGEMVRPHLETVLEVSKPGSAAPYAASKKSSIIGTSQEVRAVTCVWLVPGSTASCACGRRRNSCTACSGRMTSVSPQTTSVGVVMVRTTSGGMSLKLRIRWTDLLNILSRFSGYGATSK